MGELSHLADGSYAIAERWNSGEEYWGYAKNKLWSPFGYPVHHANKASAQVGSIVNCMFNRDCMTHTHINFIGSVLPWKLQREVAKELFRSEVPYDETKNTRQSMTQKLNMQSGRCCGSVCITPSPCELGTGQ
ncbi:hypothetical protein ACLK1S_10540 [Escherichia coli]